MQEDEEAKMQEEISYFVNPHLLVHLMFKNNCQSQLRFITLFCHKQKLKENWERKIDPPGWEKIDSAKEKRCS